MKKALSLMLLLMLCPLVAGIYGIVHDQFTYSISPEYYTKFKFFQFELVDENATGEAIIQNPRVAVAAVGFMATWWTGIFIGFGIGTAGLFQANARDMLKYSLRAIVITIVITSLTGLIGLGYGALFISGAPVNWWLPENLLDRKSFIMVGSMHNFSYLGGLIGLMVSIAYQIFKASKTNPNFKPAFNNTRYFGLKRKPKN